MRSLPILAYAGAAYLAGSAALVSFGAFLNGVALPRGIDDGAAGPPLPAVLADLALLGLFGLQHSAMARRRFKERLRGAPAALERSTYVLATAAVLAAIVLLWQPLPQPVWQVDHGAARAVLWALHGAGWLIVFASTWMLSHAALFGLSQARDYAAGTPPEPVPFATPCFYRLVRHPMMTGFLLLLWAAPEASAGRVLLNLGLTAYILAGTALEERDLHRTLGAAYVAYARRTPRLLPFRLRSGA